MLSPTLASHQSPLTSNIHNGRYSHPTHPSGDAKPTKTVGDTKHSGHSAQGLL